MMYFSAECIMYASSLDEVCNYSAGQLKVPVNRGCMKYE